ncbi:MAG TPA: chemotaxis protein CheB [Terriglobales bacterium]|nr:chemotaxis protein CheB [Terriglobales bacterium]
MTEPVQTEVVPALECVVIGVASSAGGVDSLLVLTASLPPAFPAAILIAQHLGPSPTSRLESILGRRCSLPVRVAVDGDAITPGVVVVCPSGAHLAVRRGPRLWLSREGPLHFVRPSADRLFESLARTCGRHTIAVVLSGSGTDGAAGVRAIKSAGGTVIVEDRTTARFFGMPDAAIRTGAADMILPIHEISEALVALTLEACHEPN